MLTVEEVKNQLTTAWNNYNGLDTKNGELTAESITSIKVLIAAIKKIDDNSFNEKDKNELRGFVNTNKPQIINLALKWFPYNSKYFSIYKELVEILQHFDYELSEIKPEFIQDLIDDYRILNKDSVSSFNESEGFGDALEEENEIKSVEVVQAEMKEVALPLSDENIKIETKEQLVFLLKSEENKKGLHAFLKDRLVEKPELIHKISQIYSENNPSQFIELTLTALSKVPALIENFDKDKLRILVTNPVIMAMILGSNAPLKLLEEDNYALFKLAIEKAKVGADWLIGIASDVTEALAENKENYQVLLGAVQKAPALLGRLNGDKYKDFVKENAVALAKIAAEQPLPFFSKATLKVLKDLIVLSPSTILHFNNEFREKNEALYRELFILAAENTKDKSWFDKISDDLLYDYIAKEGNEDLLTLVLTTNMATRFMENSRPSRRSLGYTKKQADLLMDYAVGNGIDLQLDYDDAAFMRKIIEASPRNIIHLKKNQLNNKLVELAIKNNAEDNWLVLEALPTHLVTYIYETRTFGNTLLRLAFLQTPYFIIHADAIDKDSPDYIKADAFSLLLENIVTNREGLDDAELATLKEKLKTVSQVFINKMTKEQIIAKLSSFPFFLALLSQWQINSLSKNSNKTMNPEVVKLVLANAETIETAKLLAGIKGDNAKNLLSLEIEPLQDRIKKWVSSMVSGKNASAWSPTLIDAIKIDSMGLCSFGDDEFKTFVTAERANAIIDAIAEQPELPRDQKNVKLYDKARHLKELAKEPLAAEKFKVFLDRVNYIVDNHPISAASAAKLVHSLPYNEQTAALYKKLVDKVLGQKDKELVKFNLDTAFLDNNANDDLLAKFIAQFPLALHYLHTSFVKDNEERIINILKKLIPTQETKWLYDIVMGFKTLLLKPQNKELLISIIKTEPSMISLFDDDMLMTDKDKAEAKKQKMTNEELANYEKQRAFLKTEIYPIILEQAHKANFSEDVFVGKFVDVFKKQFSTFITNIYQEFIGFTYATGVADDAIDSATLTQYTIDAIKFDAENSWYIDKLKVTDADYEKIVQAMYDYAPFYKWTPSIQYIETHLDFYKQLVEKQMAEARLGVLGNIRPHTILLENDFDFYLQLVKKRMARYKDESVYRETTIAFEEIRYRLPDEFILKPEAREFVTTLLRDARNKIQEIKEGIQGEKLALINEIEKIFIQEDEDIAAAKRLVEEEARIRLKDEQAAREEAEKIIEPDKTTAALDLSSRKQAVADMILESDKLLKELQTLSAKNKNNKTVGLLLDALTQFVVKSKDLFIRGYKSEYNTMHTYSKNVIEHLKAEFTDLLAGKPLTNQNYQVNHTDMKVNLEQNRDDKTNWLWTCIRDLINCLCSCGSTKFFRPESAKLLDKVETGLASMREENNNPNSPATP